MDRFSLALGGCTPTVSSIPASQQLSAFDTPTLVEVIPTRERPASRRRAAAQPPISARSDAAGASHNYEALIQAAAREHDIDPDFLRAIMVVESGANHRARSPVGAIGLMQVMPGTGRRFGAIDLYDPGVNMGAAAAYLKTLQRMFGNDLTLVLAAYNAGEGAVQKYGRRIPQYRETQTYVRRVLERYDRLIQARTQAAALLPN